MRNNFIALILFVCTAFLPFAVYAAEGSDKAIHFDVYMGERYIGTHDVRITDKGDEKEINISIHFNVSFGFLPLYRYHHSNTEIWDKDGLRLMRSSTDDNGEFYRVEANRKGQRVVVRDKAGTLLATLPVGVMTTSYWQKEATNKAELINTQTGESINVIHSKAVNIPDYYKHLNCYRMSGDLAGIICYAKDDQSWAGLEFTVNKRTITYIRRDYQDVKRIFASMDK